LWRRKERINGSAVEYLETALSAWKRSLTEPPIQELLKFARDIDAERRIDLQGSEVRLTPMKTGELADSLLLASRDASLQTARGNSEARVHLSTFHGAKGLEFDKVILFPARRPSDLPARRPPDPTDLAEERRLYYVGVTRARHRLILTTFGDANEFAAELDAPLTDMQAFAARLPPIKGGLFDCDPSHVQLVSVDVRRAQGIIAGLKEGDPLEIASDSECARLLVDGQFVGILSASGQRKFDALSRRSPGPLIARVHEIYVHYERKKDGTIRSRTLAVLPTFRSGQRSRAASPAPTTP
jgi:hypothetical protein